MGAMKQYDVIIIGGGPGGYVAAVRAGQLGLKTALVEKEQLGGTCLNWGCVPTKSLLRNAEVIHLLSKGRQFGFQFDNLRIDYPAAHKRSRSVVSRQTKRVAFLMKNNGIAVFEGSARLATPHEVIIEPSGEKISGKYIIIATGAKPRPLPGTPYDGDKVMNYRRALDLKQVPGSAVIVGAGPIGMEFATLWNRYGTKVTVVELMAHVLPLEDEAVSVEAEKQFKRNGIAIRTDAMVQAVTPSDREVEVRVTMGDKAETISVNTVLVSIGFAANSEGLGLEAVGVVTERGNINVDDQMRTNVDHIYAIGDVNGKMGLAHVASAQGVIAAEAIAGLQTCKLIYHDIPRCTFAHPEIASVGLTESQAREQGYEVATAQCPFVANGKALALEDNSGFAKIVTDAGSKKILGVHMIGGHVTELVAGPTGMISLDADAAQLGQTVHPHPTLSEALMEAAHALCGHAIHI
jgi:dihydrolipoamide dehydrogenase